jgi:aryl-alcohol dehydrogenase-like predicted oxidoreductase
MTLTQMALAYVNQQSLVMSTIIGATSLEQLQENSSAFDIILSPKILIEIEKIQELIPNPAP